MTLSNLSVSSITQTTAYASWNNDIAEDVNISVTNPSGFGSISKWSCNITGMTPGGFYTITVTGVSTGQSISTSFQTTSGSPPSGSTSISAYGVAGHIMRVSWNSVSGATGYRLYKSSDNVNFYPVISTDGQVGNVFTYDVSIDYEWQTYYFQVTPTNAYGNGSNSYSSGYKSLDETAPSVSSFYTTQITQTQITVYCGGNDNNPTAGTPSGIYRFRLYKNGSFDGYANVNGAANNSTVNQYYTFQSLAANTTYQLQVYAEDYSGNLSSVSTINPTTTSNRPANWAWYTTKASGGNFSLTSAEWNDFTNRINGFRAYKGLGSYGFTTAPYSDGQFYAFMFNQTVTAISAMSPPTAVPASQSSGNIIYASLLNGLRDSLNSIA